MPKLVVDLDAAEIQYDIDQLQTICRFFEARDEMNAAVHLAEVRRSPITVACRQIREDLLVWKAMATERSPHATAD